MKNKQFIIGGIIAVALIGIYFILKISISNTEIYKHNLVKAKEKEVANVYDDVWKTISQVAQVSEDYRTSFDSIYSHIMSDRYSANDGSLMKWIKESNPKFETTLYLDLANTIESKRGEFKNVQSVLIDVVRQYNDYVSVFPNSFFLNKEPLEVKLILSTRTNKAVETGVDDDVKLFNK